MQGCDWAGQARRLRRNGRRSAARSVIPSERSESRNLWFGHVAAFESELKAAKVPSERRSPMIFPEYRRDELKTPFGFADKVC
ncbi:MAG: hypothetical protein R6X13_07180 [bacterium]